MLILQLKISAGKFLLKYIMPLQVLEKPMRFSKAYLKIVLSSPRSFKRILAITFTNKAVNEMKEAYFDSLFEFLAKLPQLRMPFLCLRIS